MADPTYKAVIGLEVHAQLLTRTKMFSPEETTYGALPNTQVSAITLAHPGAMPSINKEAIDHAIRMGIACDACITQRNVFARKNYFYPDLPKGFQITQDKTPICTDGHLLINLPDGQQDKAIRLRRIHLEEDTGKSLHDLIPGATLLDYNRAGTPLIEIVTEADIETPEEAALCLTEIRRLLRYLEICDGNMEEGSIRCDANISLMRTTDTQWGKRVEVKNMNSISQVQLALAYEITRQRDLLNRGQRVEETTRRFDAATGQTIHQRYKETLSEYRYFPEPNLSVVIVDQPWIDRIQATMPPLPRELFEKFTTQYHLSAYDAQVLTSEKETALFFDAICAHLPQHPKSIANWVLGPIKSYLNEHKITWQDFPLTPQRIAELVQMVTDGTLIFSTAAQDLFPALVENPDISPSQLAAQQDLLQTQDPALLTPWIAEVIAAHPDQVTLYQQGKTGLLGFFIAQVMRRSQKKADPKVLSRLLQEMLPTPSTQDT